MCASTEAQAHSGPRLPAHLGRSGLRRSGGFVGAIRRPAGHLNAQAATQWPQWQRGVLLGSWQSCVPKPEVPASESLTTPSESDRRHAGTPAIDSRIFEPELCVFFLDSHGHRAFWGWERPFYEHSIRIFTGIPGILRPILRPIFRRCISFRCRDARFRTTTSSSLGPFFFTQRPLIFKVTNGRPDDMHLPKAIRQYVRAARTGST